MAWSHEPYAAVDDAVVVSTIDLVGQRVGLALVGRDELAVGALVKTLIVADGGMDIEVVD